MKKASDVLKRKLATFRRKCMCLQSISSRPTPKTLIQSGWKEFNGFDNPNLRFQSASYKGNTKVPLDQWLTAEEKPVTGARGGTYQSGFHIWTDETQLAKRKSGMRRVYYRNVHTIGEQEGTVAVARVASRRRGVRQRHRQSDLSNADHSGVQRQLYGGN